jgi:hypothetical protein
MFHAREDYQRFQDPAGKIPMDEPVMLFRAQDKYFERLCLMYAFWVEADGGDPNIVKAVKEQGQRGAAWPVKKSPDMPPPTANDNGEVEAEPALQIDDQVVVTGRVISVDGNFFTIRSGEADIEVWHQAAFQRTGGEG